MLKIFVSSVQREFVTERAAIRDYIRSDALLRRFFDVFLFEDLPASDRRADEVYLDQVDRCGIYLGLFGNEYGPANAEGLSATEREFVRATAIGKTRLIFVKGTVFELVDQAVDFVMATLARAVIPRDGKVASDVEYELPWKAVREAIVNAVTHRDYTSNASVQVMLFADRLEVWNPGELPPPLTIAGLRVPHVSISHNPLIAEPMFLAAYAEKAGSGILDMIKLCRAAGVRAPEFRQSGGQFIQTLWRPKAAVAAQSDRPSRMTQSAIQSGDGSEKAHYEAHDKSRSKGKADSRPTQSDDPVTRLLSALRGGALSPQALRQAVGLTHRQTFRMNYMRPALKAGFIERTIPGKPTSHLQKYRLTIKGRAWLAAHRKEIKNT